FLHDQQILALELDLRAGPFSEQHHVADLDIERDQLTLLVAYARANGDYLALLRLLLCGVGNDDAAGGLFVRLDPPNQDTVVQRTELHEASSYDSNWLRSCAARVKCAARLP